MHRFILSRLLSAIPVLFVVSLVTFLIMWLVPGDVASQIAGPDASAEELAAIRDRLRLDRPMYEQALVWYANLFQGDLGQSYLLNRSVVDAVLERLPVTLSLTAMSLLLAILFGVVLGVVSATNHNNWIDQATMTGALLGLSLPDFWFGLVLIFFFAVELGWFPTGGYVPFTEDPAGWLRSMALPACTLALTQMGVIARMVRSGMLEQLGQDYVRTAKAKGLPRRLVLFKHALRNALIPVITLIGVMTGILLGGAVVIEVVYSLPGVGRLIIGAIQNRDYPIVQGGLLLTAAVFVFVNIAVDILYTVIDPRVRNVR
ncbi:ABC transporter permease subunit [Rhodobacteraceae bacterium 2CG4]|uniref:ABC transporter permease subunit n=1 Tax=Halovulum marinum TaxID=2662447 RepID=A0A6L5Z3A1_9RHOB|nr:ABC transporter permease [Halovulum marinum]MSU90769.1 ABC transporter permease subunit [Halovulum marinum]